MRSVALLLGLALFCNSAPRIDNVLEKMVPPGSTSLIGAHMDAIRQTELYRRMVSERRMPDVDQFAAETGFDPRRDVRELLYATTPGEKNVLLARGSFHPNATTMHGLKVVRHGEYRIFVNPDRDAGFCILDSTLAAAGDLSAIEAALDEWKSGSHTGAPQLVARLSAVPAITQMWGVSTGVASFAAQYMPRANNGVDFSRIFRGLEDTWFEADFTTGIQASVHGRAQANQDAENLRDAAKGLIGLGRLSVPENQPELLRVWDGLTVQQNGQAIEIDANIPGNLMDKLVEMFATPKGGTGRRHPN